MVTQNQKDASIGSNSQIAINNTDIGSVQYREGCELEKIVNSNETKCVQTTSNGLALAASSGRGAAKENFVLGLETGVAINDPSVVNDMIEPDSPQSRSTDRNVILVNNYNSSHQAQDGTGSAAGSAAPLISKESEALEKKLNHFTRSRRPTRQRGKSQELNAGIKRKSHDPAEGDKDISSVNINEHAAILARIDERSYQRDLLYDANRLLEGCIFPMCFPWQHQVVPLIKNIARDIDEMHPFLQGEDELFAPFENGTFDYGKFSVGSEHRGETSKISRKASPSHEYRAAARRSYDPGVIELTTIAAPYSPIETSEWYNMKNDFSHNIGTEVKLEKQDDHCFPRGEGGRRYLTATATGSGESDNEIDSDETEGRGEIAYRSFQQVQREKKQKVNAAMGFVSKKMISVRVASTSSRSSLYPANNSSREERPLLAAALLPLEVTTGRHVSFDTALKLDQEGLSTDLGSYDVRFGTNNSSARAMDTSLDYNKEGKGRAKRTYVGRNRLIWTNKSPNSRLEPGNGSNRHYYTSLLTRNRLDASNEYKRAREIRVGIRLNANLLTTSVVSVDNRDQNTSLSKEGNIESPNNAHFQCGTLVDVAIDRACRRKQSHQSIPFRQERRVRNPICTLDCDKFLKTIVSKESSNGNHMGKVDTKSPSPDSSYGLLAGQNMLDFLKCKHPRIECLPSNEGLIRVICSSPGSLQSCFVGSFLNKASRETGKPLCSVCWSGEDEAKGIWITECIECGLFVHLDCCSDPGSTTRRISDGDMDWRCAVCSHKDQKYQILTESESSSSIRKTNRRTVKMPTRFLDIDAPDPSQTNKSESNKNVDIDRHPCIMCPHSGGAMHPIIGKNGDEVVRWAHEICSVWSGDILQLPTQNEKCTPLLQNIVHVCALCGKGSPSDRGRHVQCFGLVKCAARGCHVKFHPMCALLLSKHVTDKAVGRVGVAANTDTISDDELQKCKRKDIRLCEQYTLTVINCSRMEGVRGRIRAGKLVSTIIPMAFCGLHNPKREQSLYGCPPGGQGGFATAMRIPPSDSS